MILMASFMLMAAAEPPRPTIRTTEPETGSRVRAARDLGGIAIARQEQALWVRRIGDCMVEKQHGVALRVVASSNGGAIDYAKLGIPSGRLMDALSVRACMERTISRNGNFQWQTNDSVLRGTLVDALYRTSFSQMPPRPLPGTVAIPVHAAGSAAGDAAEAAGGEFGECIVRGNFDGADRLIRSMPYSEGERSAFAQLMPFIGPCLQAGSKAALSKPALRAVIADAAWRLVSGSATQARMGTQ